MPIIFTIDYDNSKQCKKISIELEKGVSSKAIYEITESIKLELDNLSVGRYEGNFDPKTLRLKITKAEIEA